MLSMTRASRGDVRHELLDAQLGMLRLVAVDSVFHLVAKVFNEALDGPGCCVTERADCVSFNLHRQLLEHVDFREVGVPKLNPLEQVHHPAGALSAGRALTTGLMLVEL